MTCPFAAYPNRPGLHLKYIVNSSPDHFIGILMKEKSTRSTSVGVSWKKIPANHSCVADTTESGIKAWLKHFHESCEIKPTPLKEAPKHYLHLDLLVV